GGEHLEHVELNVVDQLLVEQRFVQLQLLQRFQHLVGLAVVRRCLERELRQRDGRHRRILMQLAVSDGSALGTSLRIVTTSASSLTLVRAAVEAVLREVDETYSRFRDDSEINRL